MASPTPGAQMKVGNQRQKPNSPPNPSKVSGRGAAQKMMNISPSKPSAMYDMSGAKKKVR